MSDTLHALHVETEAAKALLANLRDIIGDDDQAQADAVEGETSLIEAIESGLTRLTELNELHSGIAALIANLKDRGERFERQRDNIRTAICAAMEAGNIKKHEFALATVSLRAVPPKVEITDESLVPSKFFKQPEPKLDKKAVLDALKAKEVVPGAVLSNGGLTVSVKGA
jgi:hypothetical protein